MLALIHVYAKSTYYPWAAGREPDQLTPNQHMTLHLCEVLPDFFMRVCKTRHGHLGDDAKPSIVLLPSPRGQVEDLFLDIQVFDTDHETVEVLGDALDREVMHELAQGWPIDYTQPTVSLRVIGTQESADAHEPPVAV